MLSDLKESDGATFLSIRLCKMIISLCILRFTAMGSSVKSSSPITTHVLNTGDGVPAARMALSLHRLDPSTAIWNLITTGWGDSYYLKVKCVILNAEYLDQSDSVTLAQPVMWVWGGTIIQWEIYLFCIAVKRLIAINRFQNKSVCLHNICVCIVYIMYI